MPHGILSPVRLGRAPSFFGRTAREARHLYELSLRLQDTPLAYS